MNNYLLCAEGPLCQILSDNLEMMNRQSIEGLVLPGFNQLVSIRPTPSSPAI